MKRGNEKKDRGSTLITVVVGVSFLLVLTAVLLSASSAGLRMKQMEYAAKKHHYSDEQILNDIYNGIGKVTTECMTRTYAQILAQVTDTAHPAYTDQDAAYRAFSHQFMEKLKDYWPAATAGTPEYDDTLDQLRAYITVPSAEAELTGYSRTEVVNDRDGVPYQYAFRDVSVRYRTVDSTGAATGYEAVITTDIVIEIPYLNFFRDSSRIFDYAMIANQGIYFKNASRTVEGNVYAGISNHADPDVLIYRDEDVAGGLNFYRSDAAINGAYVVSRGDINVRESAVTIGNTGSAAASQVFAESIRTVENRDKSQAASLAGSTPAGDALADLTIAASTYVANDLELNARKSRVTLSGEYYGYGNGVYETEEKRNVQNRYSSAAHTDHSAIIINGGQSELDLTGLNTLMVAGLAYVDIDSRAYLNEPPASGSGGLLDEYKTGESLALKTSQYLYLAPTYCLKTSNPVETAAAPAPDGVWSGSSNWFGTAGGFVDVSHPVTAKTVTNAANGKSYTYYYLNMLPGMEDDYAGTILNMIDPVNGLADMDAGVKNKYHYDTYDVLQWEEIWELKQTAAVRAAAEQTKAVTVAPGTTAGIYAEGVLSRVDGGLGVQEIEEANRMSVDTMSKIKSRMHLRYEWMYAELDPREDVSLASDLLNEPEWVRKVRNGTADSAEIQRYGLMPAGEFLDFNKLPAVLRETGYRYPANAGYKTVLAGGSYTIPAGTAFRGIIICKGDVTVSSGASVDGLIIAGGRINVSGSGAIRSNRSIVQSILDEEMTEESKKGAGAAPREDYALYVLKNFTQSHTAQDTKYRVTGTEFTDYISFQNWKKGG